jgi:hypothetical protein
MAGLRREIRGYEGRLGADKDAGQRFHAPLQEAIPYWIGHLAVAPIIFVVVTLLRNLFVRNPA